MKTKLPPVDVLHHFKEIVKSHKYILLFPLLSIAAIIVILGTCFFLTQYFFGINTLESFSDFRFFDDLSFIDVILLFFYYLTSTFIVVFFNVGMIYCMKKVLRGDTSSFDEGMSYAFTRTEVILKWSLLSATIGVIFQFLHEKLGFVGQWIITLLGIVWGISIYFVVPILAFEDISPGDAVKKSVSIMKEKWGEALKLNIVYGVFGIWTMMFIAGGISAAVGVITSSYIIGFTIFITIYISYSIFFQAVNTIFLTSAYLQINGDTIESHLIDESLLDSVFVSKKEK